MSCQKGLLDCIWDSVKKQGFEALEETLPKQALSLVSLSAAG